MEWIYFVIIIILLISIFCLVKYIDGLNEEIEKQNGKIIKLTKKVKEYEPKKEMRKKEKKDN